MATTKLRQDAVRSLSYVGTADQKAQCFYWDETLPCFGVRVFPSGRRSYVCSYRVHGRKRLATLGRVDAVPLEHARRKAKEYLGLVAGGEDPQAADEALLAAGSVNALADDYIAKHAKPKKRSWKLDVSSIDSVVRPRLGTRLAASITSSDIAKIHSDIGAVYPYAANRFLELIRKMWNVGRAIGRLDKSHPNPAAGIERFPEKKRRRYVTTTRCRAS